MTRQALFAGLLLTVSCAGATTNRLAPPPPQAQPPTSVVEPKPAPNGWRSLSPNDRTLIDSFRTTEYKRQWGLEAIRAAEAYALLNKNGLPIGGAGVVVAVSDAGIDFGHAELTGAKHDKGHTPIAGHTDGSGYTDAHGTHLAGIIAARRDRVGMHGVAFDAKIVAFYEERVVDIAAADRAGVSVINMSWAGGVCNNEHAATATKIATACDVANSYTDLKVGTPIPSAKLDLINGRDMAVFRNVLSRAAANGVILVASLAQGNEERHGFPVGFAGETSLAGQLIAVGALDRRGHSVSMGCGKSPEAVIDHCLFAPGMNVLGPAAKDHDQGGKRSLDEREYYSWSGTSHAVAHVAGAVAVLRAAWPAAAAKLIAEALLAGAKRLYGPNEPRGKLSSIYGRGRLDLAAAVDYLGRKLGPAKRP